MAAPDEKLKRIATGALSRGFALAKLSARAGAQAAGYALGNWLAADASDGDSKARLKAMLSSQAQLLASELGKLKGSVMKAGQMLSVYGEHFLPPEVNAVLKTLQNQSPPVDWPVIERVLMAELGHDRMCELEIEREAAASASLGQVHRARIRATGRVIALKVQYPGVDTAIDSDLKTLRTVLSMSRLLPAGPRYDALFEEVRAMLRQEVDYRHELEATLRFRTRLAGDPDYVVPEPVQEYSTGRVLATEWQGGLAVDGVEVRQLPRSRRNRIARLALDLYFRELFVWGEMQTDPHFGNYRVQLDGDRERLVLYDFGAVRTFAPSFLEPYRRMVMAAHLGDRAELDRAGMDVGFLKMEDPVAHRDAFAEFCRIAVEPFSTPDRAGADPAVRRYFDTEGAYDWASSDLPIRVARQGKEVAFLFGLRPPPQEVVFLDRKLGGMFIFVSALGAHLRGREILEKYLQTLPQSA